MRAAGLDALVVTHPPNIRYLTGLDASAAAALLTEDRAVLLVDFRYATAAREAGQRAGLEVEVADGSLDAAAVEVLNRLAVRRIGVEGDHFPVTRFNRLSASLASAVQGFGGATSSRLVPTDGVIESLRIVKDAAEIATLREAGQRLSAVAPARARVRPRGPDRSRGRRVGRRRDARRGLRPARPSKPSSRRAPTALCRTPGRPPRRLGAGDGVVLDFGGVYDGYCVDLTRTLTSGRDAGWLSPDVRSGPRGAAGGHRAPCTPGAAPADIDGAARRVLEDRGLGEAFGHGTGHGLGLEVHEAPRISTASSGPDRVAAGMVFTIEPGAYVPGVGGVRIEDDVLVVEGGCELLTDVPVEL